MFRAAWPLLLAAAVAPASPAGAEPTGNVTRAFNQRLGTRPRAASYLRGEQGLPVPEPPELDAPGRRAMSAAVEAHVARIAQLDVAAEVLKAQGGEEDVEVVRRRLMQRHYAHMRRLRLALWRQWLGFGD